MAGDLEPSTSSDYDFKEEQSVTQANTLAFAGDAGQSGQQPASPTTKKQAQKIIRTARMTMEVRKYEQALDSLKSVLERFEARIESEEESRHSYRVQNQFTIRVAPEKLDPLMEAIEAIGIDVDNKSINSRDVTARYVDLETRLASKRAVIQRYREILKTAKTVNDILNVEEHLRKVVEEVESMEGQLRVLKNQVGESTLHLEVYEAFDRPNVKKETFWSRIGKALGNGWRGGQEFLIGVVSLWPFWIIAGGMFWGLRRIWKKRKARKDK
jgi:chromosome segregation ATPase